MTMRVAEEGGVVYHPGPPSWHGTQQESDDLLRIAASNCTCQEGAWPGATGVCDIHRMLREDQRALDGLVFARRIAERLSREEQLGQTVA